MANAKSQSSPRSIALNDHPYIVRMEVVERGKEGVILSKDINRFERLDQAVTFATKAWRKLSGR